MESPGILPDTDVKSEYNKKFKTFEENNFQVADEETKARCVGE